jgi:hypothetical protein
MRKTFHFYTNTGAEVTKACKSELSFEQQTLVYAYNTIFYYSYYFGDVRLTRSENAYLFLLFSGKLITLNF